MIQIAQYREKNICVAGGGVGEGQHYSLDSSNHQNPFYFTLKFFKAFFFFCKGYVWVVKNS